MDGIDRKILAHLQRASDDTLEKIAASADLSVSATNERIRKLEVSGVIRAWRVELDPVAVGRPVLAFVSVAIDDAKGEAGFRRAMRRDDDVLECHHVTGGASYLVKLRLTSLGSLEEFITERLRPLPGVSRIETVLALASVKETAVIPTAIPGLEDDEE